MECILFHVLVTILLTDKNRHYSIICTGYHTHMHPTATKTHRIKHSQKKVRMLDHIVVGQQQKFRQGKYPQMQHPLEAVACLQYIIVLSLAFQKLLPHLF